MIRGVCASLLCASSLLSACGEAPVAPSPLTSATNDVAPSTVALSSSDATLTAGPVTPDTALWTGTFSTTPDARRPHAPATFMLKLEGRDSSQDYTLEIFSAGSGVPAVGTYPLQRGASGGALQAYALHRRGSEGNRYAAHEGQLQITRSSADSVAGTVTFSGTLAATCTFTGNDRGGDTQVACNATPGLRGPLLEINASFEAVRK